MEENNLTLVSGDDWEGLYHNGLLIDEDHQIRRYELVKFMTNFKTFDVKFVALNEDGIEWLHDEGSLPVKYSRIPATHIE